MLKVAVIISMTKGDNSPGCLEECQRQADVVASEGKYSFSFHINDSGKEGLPLIREEASKDGTDLFLWIDRDLVLSDGAVACLLENSEFLRHKAVITGSVSSPDKTLLFGGRTRRGRLIEPDPVIPVPCHLFDMSVCLVPEYTFTRLETPSDFFRESVFRYGLGERVAKAGVARTVAPGILAVTGRKAEIPLWKDPESTLKDKTRYLIHNLFK